MKGTSTLRGGLRSLMWVTKFTYTLFLVFCLASYVVMVLLAISRTGLEHAALATYYRGDGDMQYAKSYQELLEVTHFHLFSIPLFLFVQAHLFMLTTWPVRRKVVVVVGAFVGAACDLSAPWLITYVSPDTAIIKTLARVLLAQAFVLFALLPIYEMWFQRSPGRQLKGTG